MYTVCPKCALTLVVTAADLRVAQGFVRCGRCSNVFNALARLSEDRSASSVGVASPTLSQPIPPQPPPEPEPPVPEADPEPQQLLADADSIPDTALEFDADATDVSKVFVERAPDPQWTAATGKFKALLKKMQPSGAQAAGAAAPPAPRAPAPQPNAQQANQTHAAAARGTSAPPRAPQAPPSQSTPPSQATPRSAVTPTTGATASHATPPPTNTSASPATPLPTNTSASPAAPVPVPANAPASHAAPASAAPPQKIPTDEDAQFDIEVDAEFLAATAQFRPTTPPPQPARQPTASPPEPPATSPTRPAATPTPGTPPTQAALPPSPSSRETNEAPIRSQPPRAPIRPAILPRAPVQDVGSVTREDVEDSIDEDAAAAKASAAALLSRPALTHLWGAGTAVLMLLLAAQIVHHYRHDLAASDRFYRPLTALYSALGVSLVPRWNLAAYDVRQLGASADNTSAGQITVRASVKNTAKHAQPLPLLRVTLQDRFGNRIAARDVPPKAYLPSAIPASSFLSSGQRIDAEMAFVDPGTNAVGFEIDACLPAPGGSIACANDSAR
jgi:predicted Zn finger-like uncharacterized protein